MTRFTSETAKMAGRKGGLASARARKRLTLEAVTRELGDSTRWRTRSAGCAAWRCGARPEHRSCS